MSIAASVRRIPALLLGVLVLSTGCERVKSATPLSPSLAGPIAGVTISPPPPVEPAAGRQYRDSEQPLTIVFGNAESNSVRPFTLTFQIAADAEFSSPVYSQSGIQPSPDGINRVLLPSRLQAGRVYHWRVKGDDGANASEWSAAVPFAVLQPVVIGVPEPLAPVGGARVTTASPQLRVRNGVSTGPHGPLQYHFQASTSPAFSGLVGNHSVPAGSGETTLTVPAAAGLAPDSVVYWRVRIADDEGNIGAWSRTESYRTPLVQAPPPPQIPPPGDRGGNCATSNGPALVGCIEASYPSYLAAGVSHGQREANMAFLRDRIIEAGICGGLDLGWNKKRGTGPHSIDALAWRTGSGVEVVDIGVGYDDTSQPLRLQWAIVAGPPGYDGYSPRPSCR